MTFGGNGQDWPPRRRGTPQDEALDNLREVAERISGFLRRVSPWTILPILLALYLLTGIYIVAPEERAVVLRFGKAVRETGPGPSYRIPWPVEEVIKVQVTRIRKEEVGFRTISSGPPARYRQVGDEALMLTGDNNIVDLDFIIQYRVKSTPSGPSNFLFNVSNPDEALRDAAEAAMREVIGASKIDDALTEGKERIQVDAEKTLQDIVDQYEAGIEIVTLKLQDVGPPEPVSDAFKDVISAEQDKERMINEARGYSNDIVPKARGEAAQLINEAQAYLETKVRDAEGVAQRFIAVYDEYEKAKEVTKRRLYIETLEEVLSRVDKIIVDDAVSQQIVPYLPLDQLGNRPRQSVQPGSAP
jgi:membrane protease subunit HflK